MFSSKTEEVENVSMQWKYQIWLTLTFDRRLSGGNINVVNENNCFSFRHLLYSLPFKFDIQVQQWLVCHTQIQSVNMFFSAADFTSTELSIMKSSFSSSICF